MSDRSDITDTTGFEHDSQPWARRERETDRAHAAFVCFRDLPRLERSIAATARRVYSTPSPSPGELRQCYAWASQFDWRERAQAWDAYLDEQRQKVAVEAARELHLGHLEVGRLLLRVLETGARRLERLLEDDPTASLTPSEIRGLSRTLMELHGGPLKSVEGAEQSFDQVIQLRWDDDGHAERVIREERERLARGDDPPPRADALRVTESG